MKIPTHHHTVAWKMLNGREAITAQVRHPGDIGVVLDNLRANGKRCRIIHR
jgi:hypothetical protein